MLTQYKKKTEQSVRTSTELMKWFSRNDNILISGIAMHCWKCDVMSGLEKEWNVTGGNSPKLPLLLMYFQPPKHATRSIKHYFLIYNVSFCVQQLPKWNFGSWNKMHRLRRYRPLFTGVTSQRGSVLNLCLSAFHLISLALIYKCEGLLNLNMLYISVFFTRCGAS